MFRKHCQDQNLSASLKQFFKLRDNNKSNNLKNVIKSGLKDLERKIEEISRDEVEIEQPNEIVSLLEMILEFNNPNEVGKVVKVLTPDQMLNRLPISLA